MWYIVAFVAGFACGVHRQQIATGAAKFAAWVKAQKQKEG